MIGSPRSARRARWRSGCLATGTRFSGCSPTFCSTCWCSPGWSWASSTARRHRLRAHPARARYRAAARQPVVRLPGLPAGQEGRADRRRGDALRPERAAHVHRRLRRHAADLPADEEPDRRLAGGSGVVLHHRRDHPDRRVRRADDPQVHAARGDARHAGGHLDRLHLAAPGVPDRGTCRGSRSFRSTLVLVGWTAGVRLPGNIPAGLAAVIVGTALGWATGVDESAPRSAASLGQFGVHPPLPSGDVVVGFSTIAALLATAIPLGIYNFTEGMNNVESAAAAGDNYPLRSILLADGIGAIVGSISRQPVPAGRVYRPSRLEGGRRPHRLLTGDWRLRRGGVLPGPGRAAAGDHPAGGDPADPAVHRPGDRRAGVPGVASQARAGVVLALLPNIADWGQSQVETALAVRRWCQPDAGPCRPSSATSGAILYHGMVRFGGGATLAGLMLGAIAVFIIDQRLPQRHNLCRSAAAVLSFFGLIHGAQVGIRREPRHRRGLRVDGGDHRLSGDPQAAR